MKKNQKKKEKPNIQKIVAKTRVIELKPDCKYLFMFDVRSGATRDDVAYLMSELHKLKMGGIALYLKDKGGVEVYEKKAK